MTQLTNNLLPISKYRYTRDEVELNISKYLDEHFPEEEEEEEVSAKNQILQTLNPWQTHQFTHQIMIRSYFQLTLLGQIAQ